MTDRDFGWRLTDRDFGWRRLTALAGVPAVVIALAVAPAQAATDEAGTDGTRVTNKDW